MEQFQILKVSFGDKIVIDTYDQAISESTIEELKEYYQTDRIMSESSKSGWTSIFTKKKDNIRINKQLFLYIIGSNGWEPFGVERENNAYYFRKKTIKAQKKAIAKE